LLLAKEQRKPKWRPLAQQLTQELSLNPLITTRQELVHFGTLTQVLFFIHCLYYANLFTLSRKCECEIMSQVHILMMRNELVMDVESILKNPLIAANHTMQLQR
jgi:hypothetical protein